MKDWEKVQTKLSHTRFLENTLNCCDNQLIVWVSFFKQKKKLDSLIAASQLWGFATSANKLNISCSVELPSALGD